MKIDHVVESVDDVRSTYLSDDSPWIIGYSGGKDSSAVVKITFLALLGIPSRLLRKRVTILYCDTGVEIPVARSLALDTLRNISHEASSYDLPIITRVVSPEVSDSYFVKVIGRGYPPPTNKFRWCTDRLRVGPVRRFMNQTAELRDSLVVLGVRSGESLARDRTIQRYSHNDRPRFLRQSGGHSSIYAPILDFSTDQVWSTLRLQAPPTSIRAMQLAYLYRDATGECPMLLDAQGPACGTSRFGCWTCTVVRRDRAVENLVGRGHRTLRPLLEFRDWLARFRDEPLARELRRRNGQPGPGPLTLAARMEILVRLFETEMAYGQALLTAEEKVEIDRLWRLDGYVGRAVDAVEAGVGAQIAAAPTVSPRSSTPR